MWEFTKQVFETQGVTNTSFTVILKKLWPERSLVKRIQRRVSTTRDFWTSTFWPTLMVHKTLPRIVLSPTGTNDFEVPPDIRWPSPTNVVLMEMSSVVSFESSKLRKSMVFGLKYPFRNRRKLGTDFK